MPAITLTHIICSKSSEDDKKISKPGGVNRNNGNGKYVQSESFGMKCGGKDSASGGYKGQQMNFENGSSYNRSTQNGQKSYDDRNTGQTYNTSIQCYICGEMGHKSYAHNKPEWNGSIRINRDTVQTLAAVNVVQHNPTRNAVRVDEVCGNGEKQCDMVKKCARTCDEQCKHNMNSEGTVRLECGCKIPVIAAITKSQKMTCENIGLIEQRPLSTARVNRKVVTCLRDTGASLDLVKRSLVSDDQLTGKTVTCMLADGACLRYPIARISIESEWYTGSIEAACVQDLIYDMIVGNRRLKMHGNDKDETEQKESQASENEIETGRNTGDEVESREEVENQTAFNLEVSNVKRNENIKLTNANNEVCAEIVETNNSYGENTQRHEAVGVRHTDEVSGVRCDEEIEWCTEGMPHKYAERIH